MNFLSHVSAAYAVATANWHWLILAAIVGVGLIIGVKNYRKSHPKYPAYNVPMPLEKRKGNFGFFGSVGTQAAEVRDFTNFHMENFFDGLYEGIQVLKSLDSTKFAVVDVSVALFGARDKNGKMSLYPEAEANLMSLFDQLYNAGVMHKIRMMILLDEPNLNTTQEEYQKAVAIFNKVRTMQGYSSLKLGVIYQGGVEGPYYEFPQHDVVGFDDYRRGNYIFAPAQEYERFKRMLHPGQKIWLVPGAAPSKGAKPIDPASFEAVFHRDPEVWGIVPWIWSNIHGNKGLKEDPVLAHKYIKMGISIIP